MAESVDPNAPPATATVLPHGEALRLAQRLAAARGIPWPADPGAVSGVGGLAAHLTNRPGRNAVVWATVNKDDGLLGLFADGRLLASADRALARVIRVQVVPLTGLPHLAVMVDDLLDELVGAFFREERRRIYVWDGHGLRQVFQGMLLSERLSHAQWENRQAPALWQLQRTLGEITLSGELLIDKARHQHLEAAGLPRAPIPAPSAFRLLSERQEETRHRWNPRLRRFDPV